ncbi:unnamed protein product [Thelazia callipaeda]|uniref:m7GpppX diphosphatase n=1 Tax=Thelazia callipaeda TaxID=103827 RepID=A0A0N5D872_THECL|nr:unnamed protein product [Thelazia callipaeda]
MEDRKSEESDDQELEEIDLSIFKFKEVLAEDSTRKTAFILVDTNDGSDQAILIVERSAFPVGEQEWNTIMARSSLRTLSTNDVYSNHILLPPKRFAGIRTMIISPCSEKHIAKYRQQKRYVLHESADDYKSLTLPHLKERQLPLNWVYNLLDHRAEVERIIFEDQDPNNGFLLLPDMKWDGKELSNLYVLAIIRRKGIKSLRDLTGNDLPLLENVRQKSYAAIKEKYGLTEHEIRAYFHYQPSFYHLHIHFIYVCYDAPASAVAKAYLLEDVINNIKLVPDFYQRSTLTFALKESDPLLKVYRDTYGW